MKVLHLSTWRTPCGVADYAEHMVAHLEKLGVRSHVYPLNISDMKLMAREELREVFAEFSALAGGFDLVHIQHEFSFFGGPDGITASIRNFRHVLRSLDKIGVAIVVTFHTDPDFHVRTPRVLVRARALAHARYWRWMISPFFRGSSAPAWAVVHTRKSRLTLLRAGFGREHVSIVPMGHPARDATSLNRPKEEAKAELGLPPDCILLSIFGFVAAYKGYKTAIGALKRLPSQYHLAIVGGVHPESRSDRTIENVLRAWKGEDQRRLTITGYASRETIDTYHAATDVCLALYQPQSSFAASAGLTWSLSSGKPTVATNIPSFADINRHAQCLLLVTPNTVHELEWQIRNLTADPELQQRLVRNALRYAAQNSWSDVANRLFALYSALVPDVTHRKAAVVRPVGAIVHVNALADAGAHDPPLVDRVGVR